VSGMVEDRTTMQQDTIKYTENMLEHGT